MKSKDPLERSTVPPNDGYSVKHLKWIRKFTLGKDGTCTRQQSMYIPQQKQLMSTLMSNEKHTKDACICLRFQHFFRISWKNPSKNARISPTISQEKQQTPTFWGPKTSDFEVAMALQRKLRRVEKAECRRLWFRRIFAKFG